MGGPKKRPAVFIGVAGTGRRIEIMLLTPEGPGALKYVDPENCELRAETVPEDDYEKVQS